MAKCRLELSLDSLQPTGSAFIHGVCSSLSPVKKGRKSEYFDAQITDGSTTNIRIVGFKKSQRLKMKELVGKNIPIHIDNCEVKSGRRGERLEVLFKSSTAINASPKKFNVSTARAEPETRLLQLLTTWHMVLVWVDGTLALHLQSMRSWPDMA